MNKLNNPSSILDLISSTNELIDKTLQKQDNITSSTNIDTLVEGIYYISSTPSNLPNGLKYLIQLGSTIQIALDQTTGIVYHRAKVGGSFSDWYSCADYEDIPSVGNGTITITQGGATKGTFTTNQSGNLTIDLDAGSVSGTLTNIGTGSNSMVVSSATATDATGVTALGKDASIASGNNGTNGVAIGYNAKCGDSNNSGSAGVAVGKSAGVYSINGTAVGSASMTGGAYATAIGSGADAEGNYSIQIGKGTNTESNSMYVSVGLSDSKNYKMLDTNGKIPDDRLNTTIARTSQIPTVPTKTSDLTNDSGYITGITSSDVTTALGYTPYDSSNPNGYTTNTGTVTSVNNVSPVNGNVTLSIPAAQVNSDWNATSGKAQILNKPSLATVATSGSYNDLSNKPTIPAAVTVDSALSSTSTNPVQNKVINSALSGKYDASNPNGYTSNVGTVTKVNNTSPDSSGNVTLSIPAAQIQSDWTQTTATAKDYIKNKPSLATVATSGSYNDLSNKPTIPSVGNATITITQGGTTKGTFTTNQSSNATIALDAGGGTATDVQINGTSIVSNNVANIVTNTAYNASSNKIATMSDLPSDYLTNTATGSSSLTVGGTATTTTGSVNVGVGTQCTANYATVMGHNAKGGASSCTAIGRSTNASGSYAVALGYGATCSGGKSIQIGYGTNSTANSLFVGFQGGSNYQMLDGTTGLIPDARISSNIARTSQIPTVPTNVSSFTNDSGYITGINSTDVTTALGYTPANTTLSNLGATSSTNFDGQWVGKYLRIENSTTVGSYSHSLSNYLPDSTNKYEILVGTALSYNSANSGFCVGTVASPDTNKDTNGNFFINSYVTNASKYQYVQGIIPIGTGRTLYSEVAAGKPNNAIITLTGFRRIGTNS